MVVPYDRCPGSCPALRRKLQMEVPAWIAVGRPLCFKWSSLVGHQGMAPHAELNLPEGLQRLDLGARQPCMGAPYLRAL